MQLLCFDLDNTLVHSTKAHLKALQKSFKKNRLKIKTNKEIMEFFSLESSELVKNLYPNLKKEDIQKVVIDHDLFLIKETKKYAKIIPGAKETLKELKKEYNIAIISNCKHKEIIAILKASKITKDHFDRIIGNDQVKHPKPAPDEIIKAKQLLKVSEGYMIGDSIYDIIAGKRAKFKTIAVLTGNHTKSQLQKEKPYKILKSVKEIPSFLKAQSHKP